MSINELTQKIKSADLDRSKSERVALLKKAHILDAKGNLHKDFFKSTNAATTAQVKS